MEILPKFAEDTPEKNQDTGKDAQDRKNSTKNHRSPKENDSIWYPLSNYKALLKSRNELFHQHIPRRIVLQDDDRSFFIDHACYS